MNKETKEIAAENYRLETFESKVGLNHANAYVASIKDAFEKGAEWQEQQSSNEAVEFGFYLLSNGWSGLINEWYNPHTMQRASNKQLYELWLKTKTQ